MLVQPTPARPTSWSRADLAGLADRMLLAVRPFASPGHGRVTPPGPVGGYGHDVDGLEGFARTFLLAGFVLAGQRGADPLDLAGWYAEGLAAGTDPRAPDRWVRLDEHPQAKVEAASIALVLDLTRAWIWDRLDPVVRDRVVDYLSPAVGDDTYPRINWVWFRLVVQTFLRSVGGPFDLSEMAEDLATHDSFSRADGWLADGPERAFDHYVGWALHVYPTLWARMAGAADLAASRRAADVAALDRYLADAVHLVGGDGAPLLQGRSLIYRFATAAPFWAGAIAGVPSLSPGQLRHAATSVVRHFVEHGVPDRRGLLTSGWYGPWPALAQSYSGPSSPYWASKGLLGLCLPADDPLWTAPDEPLPVQDHDTLRAIAAPGWIVAGTVRDGLVRVVNHGTDHEVEGSQSADSPLYARLGYSTATCPLLDAAAWRDPLDQSVVLLDAHGRATHRAGLTTLTARVVDGDGVALGHAASTWRAHWVAPDARQEHHGSGFRGRPTDAGTLTVHSLVRGAYEVRLVRVDGPVEGVTGLGVGGWPVSGPTVGSDTLTPTGASTASGGLVSALSVLPGAGLGDGPVQAAVRSRLDAGPLGPVTSVPWLVLPPAPERWTAVLVSLQAEPCAPPGQPVQVRLADGPHGPVAAITWPDGITTRTGLAPRAPGSPGVPS